MDTRGETWALLAGLTDKVLALADDITVVVVVNRKQALLADSDDRATEYLSDSEASQILTGLRASGFRVRYFEGELAFIAAVLENPRLDVSSSRMLVYNLAQSGTDSGRKSLIPAFCALHGIPVCNSGAYAVSLARNKLHVHAILKRFGLPTPMTWAYSAGHGWLNGECPPEDQLLIAKACHEAASVGLDENSVGHLTQHYEAMLADRSQSLAQPMIVQPLISGREFETPVVEAGAARHVVGPAIVSLGGEVNLGERFLHYEAVAYDGYQYAAPSSEHAEAIRKIALAAPAVCEVLGLNGFARVDFRVTDDDQIFAIDVATSPHIVWHSSFTFLFQQAGWAHERMIACMVGVNAQRFGWL